MGDRTKYTPGTFSWTDLTTTDQAAAKDFYSALFGWDIEDMPAGDGVMYSMARIDGKDVAAISPQPEMLRNAGAPPTWNSYVTVESADATAEQAEKLGANVHAPPFDVLDAGRMAVIQDPHGAFFFLWQPNRMQGAALVNAPGAVVWNELSSPDLDASQAFYSELFGWTVAPFNGEASIDDYMAIKNGDANNGGMRKLEEPMPPNWLVYFGVDDIDAGLAKVEELGGRKMVGPVDIHIAKFGIVQDPQGGTFALYAGQLED